ncbi:MAG TPA: DUF177 domain-containing protein [Ktedonobacteraceae bacterium]|nr:DUF177 domain-containing protein [Ktedonobacteraceae bacterium]HLI70642.1 DUF177 domain-containing protein [Ktedonobacteraceae bacterium]
MDAMLFNVAQLMKSPVGSSFVTDFQESGEITLDNDLKVAGPISGHTRMRRTNQGLLVDGWVDLTLELSCTRCLKDFQQPMHVTFEEQFYPTVDVVTGMPLPAFDEEEIFPIDDHHQVDLTEAVRQNVLTALPMVTICQEDCKGLCPQCGKDLNFGPCDCKPETDIRWHALEKLLQNGLQP